ncbi:MAG: tRNA pseudouridine(38-40) synthase TruA [Halobacteriota archaeon]
MRAYRLAYDGRPYYGFQRQPDVPTVENVLFAALSSLGVLEDDASAPRGYAAAGRTDAGVSAIAQTVAFDAPSWLTPRALNSELPATVRAWASADAADGFHATHEAVRREYVYHLYAPTDADRSLDGRAPIDDGLAEDALQRLCGSHDYHNLTPDDEGTYRGVSGRLDRDGDVLAIELAAGGFPRELVRRLVTVVRAVGTGSMSIDRIESILGPEPIDGPDGVAPAPADPLVLSNVVYPTLAFERDAEAVTSTIAAFGERAIDGILVDRTNRSIVDRIADRQ